MTMPFQELPDRRRHYPITLDHFPFQHFQNGMGAIDPGAYGDYLTQNHRVKKTNIEFRREAGLPVREQAVGHGSIQK